MYGDLNWTFFFISIKPAQAEQPTAEIPRAKLRDLFRVPQKAVGDQEDPAAVDKEPIISERSQLLRDIIRRHEQQGSLSIFSGFSSCSAHLAVIYGRIKVHLAAK